LKAWRNGHADGTPLAAQLKAANGHDGKQLIPLVDAIPPIASCWGAPLPRPEAVVADKTDHSAPTNRGCGCAALIRACRSEEQTPTAASGSIDGSWSARSPGFITFGASECDTNVALTSFRRSPPSAALWSAETR